MANRKVVSPDGFEAWMLLIRTCTSSHTPEAVRQDMARAHVVHVLDSSVQKQSKQVEQNRPKQDESSLSLLLSLEKREPSEEELKNMRETTILKAALQTLQSDGAQIMPFTTKTVVNGAQKAYELRAEYGSELSV